MSASGAGEYGAHPADCHRDELRGKEAERKGGAPCSRHRTEAAAASSPWDGLPGILLALAACALAPAAAGDGALTDLDSLRWAHRIVLVQAQGEDAGNALANLEAEASGIAERDMLWFIVGDGRVATNYRGPLGDDFGERLRSRYFDSSPAGGRVVLIGKDGGVKSRSEDLDLGRLFERIDAMPMRRREMRERGVD